MKIHYSGVQVHGVLLGASSKKGAHPAGPKWIQNVDLAPKISFDDPLFGSRSSA